MFAKLIASASVYLVAKTLYKYKVKTEPAKESVKPETEVPVPTETEVKETEVKEQNTIGNPSNSIPGYNPYYRYTSATQRNTDDPYGLRGFCGPSFIVPTSSPTPCVKVDPAEEASSEKLGKRVESNQRSTGSLYHGRKRQKKKARRKTQSRTGISKSSFIPPTVEPTFVSVELQPDLDHGSEYARHKTPLRLRRGRSARGT